MIMIKIDNEDNQINKNVKKDDIIDNNINKYKFMNQVTDD